MSSKLVTAEIQRFLAGNQPEVLCIKGSWGVGKTYAWRHHFNLARTSSRLGATSYSYVSLFGLNSLNDLRGVIFENTVTAAQAISGPDVSTVKALIDTGLALGRRARPFYDVFASLRGHKDAGSGLAAAAFLLVRKQLVCIDDLERAGEGLKMREILGLASFLKDQRGCQVVLLLNDERLEEKAKAELERQLEKVVDVSLAFKPSPAEAAAIALDEVGDVQTRIRPLVEKLGIVNIRTIKKIERLAIRLAAVVADCGGIVLDQAMSTVALGGWVNLQPDSAPSIAFVRRYNQLELAIERQAADANAERWATALQDYGFTHVDDFDSLILDGVERGYFDEDAVRSAARALQEQYASSSRNNSFTRAWDQFRGSLALDDDKALDDLYNGSLENLISIPPGSLNATIVLLREGGRGTHADDLIAKYVATHRNKGRDFFDPAENWIITDDPLDQKLAEAFREQLETFTDERDPETVIVEIGKGQGWGERDVELLGKLSADDYERIFESLRGADVRRAIKIMQLMGSTPERAATIGQPVDQALRRIAAKSPLRAVRMRSFGIRLGDEPPAGPQPA